MSRSYKHTPIAKDNNGDMRVIANRWLRRQQDIAPGRSQYRKHGINGYRICDWVFYGGTWKTSNWDKLFLRK